MNPKTITCFALAFVALTTSAVAQESKKTVQTPEEPVVVSDYQPPGSEAQIVIRPGDEDQVFYEYRVGGELKEIKVVPKVGPEYYLVPAEGGGWIRENETDLLVPSWVLFRW
ncbi:DUF2782 domain-containing protein [Marinobacter sp. CHS3-4]|uniref:DUF2782 domain-containing protein n=1 Tax=Marinobacter sp. CHS3-4 TaxID=3045174 RepID=UPI0024B5FD87|nr:DUF2782 domain-containing protein [Marinobacter sp. CHS3-4]MDI9246543.1 DUF2782 domain-containing protein [Marinobacter sp. CHS3-4]